MFARAARRTLMFCIALALVAALWELYKAIGPEEGGRFVGIPLAKTSDRAMPHTWDMVSRLTEPENRAGGQAIWRSVVGYAWFTFKLSFLGLVLGTVVGVSLAVLMARFRTVERGLLPWVIMSQTVPLIALAPQVVSWSGRFDLIGWAWPREASVVVLASFLSFFPIAIGTLRGLSSAPAAALELMDSYAASWWQQLTKLRFPAAVPYIVPAMKLAATLSVVGVVVSEISTGMGDGIGRAVISYGQAATGDPTKVYAAVFGAAALGLVLYGLVVVIDVIVMRNRPSHDQLAGSGRSA